MSPSNHEEKGFLQAAFLDASLIDKAIQQGLTPACFTDPHYYRTWELLCNLRMSGADCDFPAFYTHAVREGVLNDLGGGPKLLECSDVSATTIGAGGYLAALIDAHAKRQAYRIVTKARESLEQGEASLEEIGQMAGELASACAGVKVQHRTVKDIAADALAEAKARIEGTTEPATLIMTGLPTFDKWATPMQRHEYVVVAARSSHGKSSLLLQIAGHNLSKGLRVAIFTLETADKAVLKQMAAQRVGVNLRHLDQEMPDRQAKYLKALEWLGQTKNLMIFDKDITLDAITARCRLLAQSYRPDIVILDYLQLVAGTEGSEYERNSAASKAMIPLQKALGCVLMAGVQLNQESEKEARCPGRTDFRGSGQILEDCHRAIAIWRIPGQPLDNTIFESELIQLKNRDGPLTKVKLEYNAPHTSFREVVKL